MCVCVSGCSVHFKIIAMEFKVGVCSWEDLCYICVLPVLSSHGTVNSHWIYVMFHAPSESSLDPSAPFGSSKG